VRCKDATRRHPLQLAKARTFKMLGRPTKRAARRQPFFHGSIANQLLPDKPAVLLPFLADFFLSASADALLEQQPAASDFEHEAPFASVDADAPADLLQHEPAAALSLSQEPLLASVEAEAPADLLQHEPAAALSLLHDAFSVAEQAGLLASLETVCSVLAFLSAGASVDWADAAKAKKANAPRTRNFFMISLSFIR
jgi:hypothetical protein